MIHRLSVYVLGLAFVLGIMLLAAIRSPGADFDSDWLLEDLTCEELVTAYQFEVEVHNQIRESWHNCNAFYDCEDCNAKHGALHCALIKKEGEFIRGIINDLVAVHKIKCALE